MNDKISNFQHQDSIMQFRNGLNGSYSQVRTQILMMEPIPLIDKAFTLVIQEERQRYLEFNVSPSVESTTLAVKNQGFNQSFGFSSNDGKNYKGNIGKGRPVCGHCCKLGHIMEKCYKLVGYFSSYKQKGRPAMANQVSVEVINVSLNCTIEQQLLSFHFKIMSTTDIHAEFSCFFISI